MQILIIHIIKDFIFGFMHLLWLVSCYLLLGLSVF